MTSRLLPPIVAAGLQMTNETEPPYRLDVAVSQQNGFVAPTEVPTMNASNSVSSKPQTKVAKYKTGQKVLYTNGSCTSLAEVIEVHFDDELEPFYTINVDGKEKQTDDAHLAEYHPSSAYQTFLQYFLSRTSTNGDTSATSAKASSMKATSTAGPSKTTTKVAKYKTGQKVLYTNGSCTSLAEVIKVHLDDELEPFYTINVEGKEKQTDDAHLAEYHPVFQEKISVASTNGDTSATLTNVSSMKATSTAGPSKKKTKAAKYKPGQKVLYTNGSCTSPAEVINVHFDDELEPFYTINVEGKEKQTDDAHLAEYHPVNNTKTNVAKFKPGQKVFYTTSGYQGPAEVMKVHFDGGLDILYTINVDGMEKLTDDTHLVEYHPMLHSITKAVKYKPGQKVYYKGSSFMGPAEVISVDFDNEQKAFYTIKIEGKEKQTDDIHLAEDHPMLQEIKLLLSELSVEQLARLSVEQLPQIKAFFDLLTMPAVPPSS